MVLTEEQRVLYETRLTDAEDALHTLLTGRQARVFVDQNGERVEYAVANAERLRAYILELRTLLGKMSPSGPLRPWML